VVRTHRLRPALAVFAVSAGLLTAAPLATTPVAQPTSAAAACRQATIGGQSKCIGAGQYCSKSYERDYRRYGFTCNKRDARGRWHLQYR
jgi:hypothetical protein